MHSIENLSWMNIHPDVCSMGLKIALKSDIFYASVLNTGA